MIYTEAKKLHLITSLINETDDIVLKQVEEVLMRAALPPSKKFADFSNVLSADELDEFERNIEEGCEQINEDDWK